MMGVETLFIWRGLLVRTDGESVDSVWVCHPEDENGSSAYPRGLVQRDRGRPKEWTARLTFGHVFSVTANGGNITEALDNALMVMSTRAPIALAQLEELKRR